MLCVILLLFIYYFFEVVVKKRKALKWLTHMHNLHQNQQKMCSMFPLFCSLSHWTEMFVLLTDTLNANVKTVPSSDKVNVNHLCDMFCSKSVNLRTSGGEQNLDRSLFETSKMVTVALHGHSWCETDEL